MLSKYVNERHSDWDKKLPSMLFAYRTAVHDSTKKSPFFLVYGRQARLPIDLDLPSELDANESPEDVLKRRCDAFIDLNCTREEAAANIRKAQKKTEEKPRQTGF
ncbi:hypothetical protein FSP39_012834 [Pinctada imbricata]|uniref:Uncharacterized protein n=1 Tax=Pinctada imbricata TaxID=66713 RepID=A0AA88XD86_PINIB|nr:hypothetical protein FSP39_012834 [Pinctada imbricata]